MNWYSCIFLAAEQNGGSYPFQRCVHIWDRGHGAVAVAVAETKHAWDPGHFYAALKITPYKCKNTLAICITIKQKP
ncbi:hypothetical protein VNO77_05342 [Canavalia gladiata]|uniref:Uncharacterized protein n=1 Tax=Canavalia gladiata TaxID=3824 RepID=A0AAN9MY66_CANGL